MVSHWFLSLPGRVKELNGLSKGAAQNTKLTEESEGGSSFLDEASEAVQSFSLKTVASFR